jgi:hypothetical protein
MTVAESESSPRSTTLSESLDLLLHSATAFTCKNIYFVWGLRIISSKRRFPSESGVDLGPPAIDPCTRNHIFFPSHFPYYTQYLGVLNRSLPQICYCNLLTHLSQVRQIWGVRMWHDNRSSRQLKRVACMFASAALIRAAFSPYR